LGFARNSASITRVVSTSLIELAPSPFAESPLGLTNLFQGLLELRREHLGLFDRPQAESFLLRFDRGELLLQGFL